MSCLYHTVYWEVEKLLCRNLNFLEVIKTINFWLKKPHLDIWVLKCCHHACWELETTLLLWLLPHRDWLPFATRHTLTAYYHTQSDYYTRSSYPLKIPLFQPVFLHKWSSVVNVIHLHFHGSQHALCCDYYLCITVRKVRYSWANTFQVHLLPSD